MRTPILRLLGVAALTAALAGCSGGGSEPAAPSTTTAAPPPATSVPAAAGGATTAAAAGGTGAGGTARCTAADLTVTLGSAEGAAGSVYRSLVFTNKSSRICELVGFPGVSYVAGDDGHQVGPAAVEQGPRAPQVNIAPGKAAAAQVQFVQVANFDPAVCRPTPVRGVRVYPPGEAASVFVAADGTGCAGNPPGPQLSVQTMKPA